MKEGKTMRTVLGGFLGAILGLGLLAGTAGATDFEVVADSFTVINQVNLASATYMKGMPLTGPGRPAAPADATSFGAGAVPGGMFFDKDEKTYKVWDIDAGAWVKIATGTIAGSQVDGSGTADTVTKWTGAGTVGDSSITDDGTTVTMAPSGGVTVTPALTASAGMTATTGGVTVTAGGVTVNGGDLTIADGNNLTMSGPTGTADILGLQVSQSGGVTTLKNSAGVALVNIK